MSITFFPETEVVARGLRWEVVHTAPAGMRTRCHLRCLAEPLRGHEIDLLTPSNRSNRCRAISSPKGPRTSCSGGSIITRDDPGGALDSNRIAELITTVLGR